MCWFGRIIIRYAVVEAELERHRLIRKTFYVVDSDPGINDFSTFVGVRVRIRPIYSAHGGREGYNRACIAVPQVATITSAIPLFKVVIAIRLEQGNLVVITVQRPVILVRMALVIVWCPFVYVPNCKSTARLACMSYASPRITSRNQNTKTMM